MAYNNTKMPMAYNSTKVPMAHNHGKVSMACNHTKLPMAYNNTKMSMAYNNTKMSMAYNHTTKINGLQLNDLHGFRRFAWMVIELRRFFIISTHFRNVHWISYIFC